MKSLNNKGISPVIATVIIVSVAIAIAVAVAFWMTGITGLFTRYEKIEVTNAYAVWNDTDGPWLVVLQLRNSGSDTATIDDILINVKPSSAYTGVIKILLYKGSNGKTSPTYVKGNNFIDYYPGGDQNNWDDINFQNEQVTINAGEEKTIAIIIDIPDESGFAHGQSVEFKVHTVAGKEYPKTVVLP
ncbi:MAG: DUF4352 domain-containing protein [archaeon GB-1867-005]|nr:DUF4352 domain-containing protein [Candidatus Culexmicrobium cathedralense]